jgi:hypothetical protein
MWGWQVANTKCYVVVRCTGRRDCLWQKTLRQLNPIKQVESRVRLCVSQRVAALCFEVVSVQSDRYTPCFTKLTLCVTHKHTFCAV